MKIFYIFIHKKDYTKIVEDKKFTFLNLTKKFC